MPNFTIDDKALKKLGFIQKINGGVDYLTVAGVQYIAHESGRLLGIEADRVNVEDKEWLTVKATVRVLNTHVLTAINDLDPAAPEREAILDSLLPTALIGVYTDYAQSPRTGGKSAEAKTPLEVAVTSAVGRALRKAGFGVNASLATYDEIVYAQSRDAGAPAGAVAGPSPKKLLADKLKATGRVKSAADANKLAAAKFGADAENPVAVITDLSDKQVAAWLAELDAEVPF